MMNINNLFLKTKVSSKFCLNNFFKQSLKYFGSGHHEIKHSHSNITDHKVDKKDHHKENHDNHGHHNEKHHDSHDHCNHDHGHDHDHGHKVNPIELYFSKPYHLNHYKLNHLDHSNNHGHGHGHGKDVGHKSKFDHVKYTQTLNQQQRIEQNQKVSFIDDDLNPQTAKFNVGANKVTPGILDKMAQVMIPYESSSEVIEEAMDETEIRARIYNLLRQFDFLELEKFDFSANFETLGLDSLDWTALLTSIEYEFHTVFNDTFYEHWNCLNDVVQHLKADEHIF